MLETQTDIEQSELTSARKPEVESVAAEGEYSTAFDTYYTSATYGVDIFNKGFFVGPEVAVFGDTRFDQWRVGARITGFKIGRVDFDFSTGFARDSVVGSGAYGHVEMTTSF